MAPPAPNAASAVAAVAPSKDLQKRRFLKALGFQSAGMQARRKTSRPFPANSQKNRPFPKNIGRCPNRPKSAQIGPIRPKSSHPGQFGPVWAFPIFPGSQFGVSYFSRCHEIWFPGVESQTGKRPEIGSPRGHFGREFAPKELRPWATFWADPGPRESEGNGGIGREEGEPCNACNACRVTRFR